jgi:hypothetical protein
MKTSTHAAGNMLDLDAAFGSLEYSEPGAPQKQQRFESSSTSSKTVELETYQPPGMPSGLRGGPGYKSDQDEELAMKARIEQKEKAAEMEMIKRLRAKEMQMQQQAQAAQQPQQHAQAAPPQMQAQPPQMQQAPPPQHQAQMQQKQAQMQQAQMQMQQAEAYKRVQQQDQMMRRPESAGMPQAPTLTPPAPSAREVRSAGPFARFSKSLTAGSGEEGKSNCVWTYVMVGLAFLFLGVLIAVVVCSSKRQTTAVFMPPPQAQPALMTATLQPPPKLAGGGSSTIYDLL